MSVRMKVLSETVCIYASMSSRCSAYSHISIVSSVCIEILWRFVVGIDCIFICVTKFERGLQSLHDFEDDALNWLDNTATVEHSW